MSVCLCLLHSLIPLALLHPPSSSLLPSLCPTHKKKKKRRCLLWREQLMEMRTTTIRETHRKKGKKRHWTHLTSLERDRKREMEGPKGRNQVRCLLCCLLVDYIPSTRGHARRTSASTDRQKNVVFIIITLAHFPISCHTPFSTAFTSLSLFLSNRRASLLPCPLWVQYAYLVRLVSFLSFFFSVLVLWTRRCVSYLALTISYHLGSPTPFRVASLF